MTGADDAMLGSRLRLSASRSDNSAVSMVNSWLMSIPTFSSDIAFDDQSPPVDFLAGNRSVTYFRRLIVLFLTSIEIKADSLPSLSSWPGQEYYASVHEINEETTRLAGSFGSTTHHLTIDGVDVSAIWVISNGRDTFVTSP